MIPKKNRLKKKKEISILFKKGKVERGNLFFLKKRENDLEETRVGFIVPVKITKKAVTRNKLKRRMREIVRKKIKKIKRGKDIIIVAKKSALQADYYEQEEAINLLLKKAKII